MASRACGMASTSLRSQVLATYRQIMRLSWAWRASVVANSAEEGAYIRNEARTLFRKNMDVSKTNRLPWMIDVLSPLLSINWLKLKDKIVKMVFIGPHTCTLFIAPCHNPYPWEQGQVIQDSVPGKRSRTGSVLPASIQNLHPHVGQKLIVSYV